MPTPEYLVLSAILLGISFLSVRLKWLGAFAVAFSLVILHGNLYQDRINAVFDEGQDITISGQIDSFFRQLNYGFQASFAVDEINGRTLSYIQRPVIRVIWPELPADAAPGQRWQLSVRLKPVKGRLNKTGFDKEAHYLAQGWHADAVVREARRSDQNISLRGAWYQKIIASTSGRVYQDYILALTFADRSGISSQEWQGLRNSGLIHLLAISGLHVGLAYFAGWWTGRWLAALIVPLPPWLGMLTGLMAAAGYAWLSGFTLPAQRALIMCFMLVMQPMLKRHYSPWQVLAVALAVILSMDPFAPLSQGFWLSFAAVVAIFLANSFHTLYARTFAGRLRSLVIVQFWLFLGLLPFSIIFFQGVSWLGLAANVLFVPWVSMVTMPLVMAGLLITPFAPGPSIHFWKLVDMSLTPVLFWQPQSLGWISMTPLSAGLVLVLALLIAGRYWKMQRLTVVLSAIMLMWLWPASRQSGLQLSVLDVGHGLAVTLVKNGKAVLYDTGTAWPGGSNVASVVVPHLGEQGITSLTGLILSHFDSDHAGGKEDAETLLSPDWMRASQLEPGYLPCVRGAYWEWQGVKFDALWPPARVTRAYNPHSCVVMVTEGQYRILLGGDIDAISEWLLLRGDGNLAADIILVPHHGSITSSTENFVKEVSASLALGAMAYDNHWNMPNPAVVTRYEKHGARWLDTASSGQILVSLKGGAPDVKTARVDFRPRWFRDVQRNPGRKF